MFVKTSFYILQTIRNWTKLKGKMDIDQNHTNSLLNITAQFFCL